MNKIHEKLLRKKENEMGITDVLQMADKYCDMWALLVDKGYQGITQIMRRIHPRKKPANGEES